MHTEKQGINVTPAVQEVVDRVIVQISKTELPHHGVTLLVHMTDIYMTNFGFVMLVNTDQPP